MAKKKTKRWYTATLHRTLSEYQVAVVKIQETSPELAQRAALEMFSDVPEHLWSTTDEDVTDETCSEEDIELVGEA